MTTSRSLWSKRLAGTFIVSCCIVLQTQAQFGPGGGGFGGFGGGGGGANANRSRSTTRQYPNSAGVGDAVLSMATDERSLVVIADPKTLAYVSNVVANLDRPKPQVLIKVVFLEVTRNTSLDIGIEGGWTGTNSSMQAAAAIAHAFGLSALNQGGSNTAPLNAYGIPTSSFAPVPPGAGVYQVVGSDYQATLRAIATAGKTKILSRPSIIARNSQPATINVGQSVPLVTAVRYDSLGNAINSVSYTPVGIILQVTPFISSDGMVEMILTPTESDLVADRSQWVPISTGPSGSISAPLINTRSADTVVVTPNGQTVIIGGLMASAKGDTVNKIPILGDIPVLGFFFRHTIKSDANTELLIFLTPYIIPAPTELADITAREANQAGIRTGFTEKELNQFLDNLPKDSKSKSKPSSNHDMK